MKIETYIKAEFEKRLDKHSCLVIHDEEGRYAAIALSLASDSTKVIDATGSLVIAREAALEAWSHLPDKAGFRLVVYLPWAKPKDRRAKREDAFAPFSLGGAVFPDGDADSYRELCIQAFPAQEAEVEKLFDSGLPSFEAVNSLAGGAIWPGLRALLGVDSEREMLLSLLAPSAGLKSTLDAGGPWLEEARRLAKASLDLELLGGDWPKLQESLGRYLLFSEFALDIPGPLPSALSEVPHAGNERRNIVFALCEALRDSLSTRPLYRELATKVEGALGLAEKFARVESLGKRETFMFQNRAILHSCVALAKAADFGAARQLCLGEEASVWFDSSAAIRSVCACAKSAIALLDGVSAFDGITDGRKSVSDLVVSYVERFSGLDAAYRDLEAFLSDMESGSDLGEELQGLVDLARSSYFKTAETLHREFLQAVGRDSWIGPATSDQAAVFKSRVAPRLESREKTAYFMIDALRLDLARELVLALPPGYHWELNTVRAKLPSVTPVGMAALLPGAESKLSVDIEAGAIAPHMGSTRVANAQERIAYLKSVYGDLVRDVQMNELEGLKKSDLGDAVVLLVVRSTEIDSAGESLGAEALPMLSLLLRNLLRAIERSRKLGFSKAIIATDHGFLLQPPSGAGGAAAKPEGVWEASGPRYLLGDGAKNASSRIFDAGSAGVPGYSKKYSTPAGLGSFVSGTRYVHGGLSLQECVLPVITIGFPSQAPKKREIGVSLSYKGGLTRKITTMRPSFDLSVSNPDVTDLFGGEHEAELPIAIMVRAAGKEVGRPQASSGYDPGSGCYRIKPGKAIKITIAMNDEHRGAFTVSALDPVTLEQFAKLDLETDYTE